MAVSFGAIGPPRCRPQSQWFTGKDDGAPFDTGNKSLGALAFKVRYGQVGPTHTLVFSDGSKKGKDATCAYSIWREG